MDISLPWVKRSAPTVDKAPKRRPLTPEEQEVSDKLRRFWDERKGPLGLNQDKAGEYLGISTQGGVSHYLRGWIPVGTDVLFGFCKLLHVQPGEINPRFKDFFIADPELVYGVKRMLALPKEKRHFVFVMAAVYGKAVSDGDVEKAYGLPPPEEPDQPKPRRPK